MEPGHEDREYPGVSLWESQTTDVPQWSPVMKTGNTQGPALLIHRLIQPQWSPVMKTGNTGRPGRAFPPPDRASMEPGHEDREYI